MTLTKKPSCPKKKYQKIGFDLKLSIIDQIANGQISVNYAAKLHGISRSSITYWMKKLRSFEQNSKTMSKNQELKKLKERIEELEFVKDFQQMIIADFENSTNLGFAKKLLPEALYKEVEKKMKDLSKRNGSTNASV
jgi:transposase-like protein